MTHNAPPPDLRRARARALLKASGDLASLHAPNHLAPEKRELVVQGAALSGAIVALLDAAAGESDADPMQAFCVVMVQRASEAGLSYEETVEMFKHALARAIEAHAVAVELAPKGPAS